MDKVYSINCPKVYGCKAHDDRLRETSSSGGVFSLIAENIIKRRGVVYGVAMSIDCYQAEFIRVTTIDELYKLRGSKYIQANLGRTFQLVKDDLENNMLVLFSGSPCQINGLRNFLGNYYTNLICVDFICHGVPSPKLWKKYIDFIENKYASKIVNVNFRSKKWGWGQFGINIIDVDGKDKYVRKEDDIYLQMFLRDICLRESCYNCVVKTKNNSDLQLGDFWGVSNIAPKLDDNKGVSMIIINTITGFNLFQEIVEKIEYEEICFKDAVESNIAICKSVSRPDARNEFYYDLDNMQFEELIQKYLHFSWKKKIKLRLFDTPLRNVIERMVYK